jgi:hypothetical protein
MLVQVLIVMLRGFACTASAKAFDTVNELAASFLPLIEEDQIVSINNGV